MKHLFKRIVAMALEVIVTAIIGDYVTKVIDKAFGLEPFDALAFMKKGEK